MEKEIFRKEDKVFDISYGWGIVKLIDNYAKFPIGVKFGDNLISYTADGKKSLISVAPTLSFTEYGLNNKFTQKRPINYNDYIGKWGKFWNDNPKYFTIGILKGYEQDGHKPFQSVSLDFQKFKPLTEEKVKILELE